ncbi:DUF302 domain-containing protein [Actinomadura sp. WMMA1423]|uniref:DUF302 domain-containing protein n=1 Tax=Actinomadura sp. WMMA1423 TaxID=2591108 RepID=UPI001146E841|nr:DUF302 domain-containing protein [Actinomadura sp. WMMA1423]
MEVGTGLRTIASDRPATETVERLESAIVEAGFAVFARVDHAGKAAEVGLRLPPTVLLMFGNPRVGTLLMQDRRSSAIDLPTKVLVWEDEDGKAWLTYNDPAWIAERHGLRTANKDTGKAIAGMEANIAAIVHQAGGESAPAD